MSLALFVIACHREDPGGDSTSVEVAPRERPLAGGLTIDKVKLYQGTETVLFNGAGQAPGGQPPVIAGRDAQVRVFVDLDAAFAARDITAALTITDGGEETVLEDTIRVEVDSKPALFDSTFDFAVAGALLTPTSTLSVRLLEELPTGLGGGNPADAEWAGPSDAQVVDPLTIVIFPIVYHADGSDRLPDTSAAQVARISDLVRGLYPAAEVEVRVERPYDWDGTLGSFDIQGWSQLLNQMVVERAYAAEAPNTYYYGLFAPAESVYEYCATGCLLGLSYVAYTPTLPALRASIGVGFSGDIASETLVHEVGHAHGREHAPCGLFGQASDPEYPHDQAETGAWGWDGVTDDWFDPETSRDLMSYCQPLWVSDYTWSALAERALAISAPERAAPVRRSTVLVDASGRHGPGPELEGTLGTGGLRRELTRVDPAGVERGTVGGAFFPLDHGAGGMIVLDEQLPSGWSAR